MGPEKNIPEISSPGLSNIEVIKIKDLLEGYRLPGANEALICLQVNARDIRDPNSEDLGMITPDSALEAKTVAIKFFQHALEHLSAEEKSNLDILVFSSNSELITPGGLKSELKRAVQSGNAVIEGVREVMEDLDMKQSQLINNVSSIGGGPFEVSELIDLKVLRNEEGYLQYLKDKYMSKDMPTNYLLNSGSGLSPQNEEALWIAFENDAPEDRKVRLELGAEGPDEIADRVGHFVSSIKELAFQHISANPGRRVIVWAVGHYDNISPYIKKYVLQRPMESRLSIDKNAGISILIDEKHNSSTRIRGREFNVEGLD